MLEYQAQADAATHALAQKQEEYDASLTRSKEQLRAMQMLDWFIKEQGEEEKSAADLITKMELFGGDSKGLYMLNSELAGRVYSAPSLVL